MQVGVDQLAALQKHTERIRNICVLAHVDHGKTTLSDHLIASNGLIHPKLVGELRYLDSRDDEQARGITMKSSSIALLHVSGAAGRPGGLQACSKADMLEKGVLVNLIDSPGHVDFCSEVSTAARLSDGAVVMVDAVEGVCIQTHAVLRQAWQEKVRMCLVINKIDRLVLELRLTPAEAHRRLEAILTHVNMVVSGFQSEHHLSEADAVLATGAAVAASGGGLREEGNGASCPAIDLPLDGDQDDDDEPMFSPQKGNVAFASAADGWGFRIEQFAAIYAAKLDCSASALKRALWGNFAFNPKTRRIVRIQGAQHAKLKPLFVQLALEPLWRAYEAAEVGAESRDLLLKMVQNLGLAEVVDVRGLARMESRAALRAVLRAWLPLAEAVLGMSVEVLPHPRDAAPLRTPHLLPQISTTLQLPPATQEGLQRVEAAVRACDTTPCAPLVIYVSKMVAVPAGALPRRPGDAAVADNRAEVFLAFGRVFAGVVREGAHVHVLSPAYNPAFPAAHRQEAQVTNLYLMMGRGLERLAQVPAGNVLAIGGLDTAILKSATLSNSPIARPLAPMLFQAAPIVRVAVEPAQPGDMAALTRGLALLDRADPFVEIALAPSGEHVLGAAGEVHMETVIKDLRERFARCELTVSPPLVAFRESAAYANEAPDAAALPSPKVVEARTANGICVIRARAHPLPAALATTLDTHADVLQRMLIVQGAQLGPAASSAVNHHVLDADSLGEDQIMHTTDKCSGLRSGQGHSGSLHTVSSKGADGRTAASDRAEAKGGTVGLSPSKLTRPASAKYFAPALDGTQQLPEQKDWEGRSAAPPHHSTPCGQTNERNHVGDANADELYMDGNTSRVSSGVDATADAVKTKLRALSSGAGSECFALLARTWLLGPRRIGPNLLLVPGHDQANLPPLWDVPRADVVALGKRAADIDAEREGPRAPGDVSAEELAEEAEYSHPGHTEGHTHLQWQDVQFGECKAAATLGFVPESSVQNIGSLCGSVHRVASPDSASSLCHDVEAGVAAGFELASAAGPLCDEPLWGIAFEVEARVMQNPGGAPLDLAESVYGPLTGQVTSCVRGALRRAVLEAAPRLVEAYLLCEVAAASEALAGAYAVLGRRRARVVSEELREGSTLFSIHAYMPVQESFGLAAELGTRTSGGASAALMLSHWERLQVDPFFIPRTAEEREEWGEEGQGVGATNLAKQLIDNVRLRKGLHVGQKVVASATKQRTRARKV